MWQVRSTEEVTAVGVPWSREMKKHTRHSGVFDCVMFTLPLCSRVVCSSQLIAAFFACCVHVVAVLRLLVCCLCLLRYTIYKALCVLWGCKNMARSISWPEVVPNQVVFLSGFFCCLSVMFRVYVVFCFFVFGCQYHCTSAIDCL